jgi:hypothetical protein
MIWCHLAVLCVPLLVSPLCVPGQYKISVYTLSSLYTDEVNVVAQHLICLQTNEVISTLEQHN